MEKLGEESIEKLKQTGERIDLETLQKDVEDYLNILKKAFYKEQKKEESHD